jgi:hypothetical protein
MVRTSGVSRGWNGKEKVVGEDKRDHEPPEGEATVLPEREAISLITSDPSAGSMSDLGDDDRDEHSSKSDSASSQT